MENQAEAQRDGWRMRRRGGRKPPEFRVKATHTLTLYREGNTAKQNQSPWDSHRITGSVVFQVPGPTSPLCL